MTSAHHRARATAFLRGLGAVTDRPGASGPWWAHPVTVARVADLYARLEAAEGLARECAKKLGAQIAADGRPTHQLRRHTLERAIAALERGA